MTISNPTKQILYFNRKTKQIYSDLYEFLSTDLIKLSSIVAHEKNISNFFYRPDEYNEVIPGITIIPPRTRWYFDGKNFHCLNENSISPNYKSDISEFLQISQRLSSVLKNKAVAIELSGGLDTSILIGIMRHFGFDPFLIGVKSKRYELRTESFIQEKFAKSFNKVCLLDEDESLPFTKLKSTPIHSLPSSSSLYYMHASSIAKECQKKEINILLSGMGFDALLCESTRKTGNDIMPKNWFNWMLEDYWFSQNIYSKHNMTYNSGAASQLIIKSIWALRKTQNEDPKKWWARNAFKVFLPTELVNYSYKADNSGSFLDGFLNSKNEITEIYKVAYEITKFKEFEKSELKKLFVNSHIPDETKDKLILSRVSFANWIFGLVRENII